MVKRKKMSMVEELPPEIVVKITSRLPVKSIINCMRVCKLWRTLIPNPFLAKSDPTYLVLYDERSARFAILDHDQHLGDQGIVLMKPCFPRSGKITVLGCCNGLICFKQCEHIYIYNPMIGECATVPKPSLTHSQYMNVNGYAFGFCPISAHYKLFRRVFNPRNHKARVEIYTLGSKAWRRINADAGKRVWNEHGRPVCVGGVVHWINMCGILTFDLAMEEFGFAPPPPLGKDKRIVKLGSIDHCLIATVGFTSPCSGSGMEVWVRRESSWSKNCVILDTHSRIRGCLLRFLEPKGVSADGQILMTSILTGINHNDSHASSLGIPRSWSGLIPCDATLVSPHMHSV